jgi:hypothetical protein
VGYETSDDAAVYRRAPELAGIPEANYGLRPGAFLRGAALRARPRLYFQSPALLLAVLPTLHGGWATKKRWGGPKGEQPGSSRSGSA